MKTLIPFALLVASLGAVAQNDHYVNPYYRSDGTYVQGHHQTNPDSSRTNNYSSQGNVNPYTGQAGTVNPYAQPQTPYIPPPQYPNPQDYYQRSPLYPQMPR